MTSPTAIEAKHLIGLAERMGIPTDAAIRQVEQLIADLNPQRDRSRQAHPAPNGADGSRTVLIKGVERQT